VFKGDVKNPETIKGVTTGIHTIVSCLVGEDDVVVEGQKAILNDAIANGVKRFVPSDYSFDYTKVPENGHKLSQQRKDFRKILEAANIKALHLHVGWFIDTYLWTLNYMGKGLAYWGDNPNQKLDFSTFEDAAKVLALAITDPHKIGDCYVSTAGVYSTNEVADIYNQATGENLTPVRLGSFQDLQKIASKRREIYEEKLKKGDIGKIEHIDDMAQPDFFWGIFLVYQQLMFDGTGQLPRNDIKEFPQIKPVSFREYLETHPDQRIKIKFLDMVGQELSAAKDAVFQRIEDAIHFLSINAQSLSADVKAKLSHLLSKPETSTEPQK